jgi:hypothetical protein
MRPDRPILRPMGDGGRWGSREIGNQEGTLRLYRTIFVMLLAAGIIAAVSAIAAPSAEARTVKKFSVTKFGARSGDGRNDSTAFQRAVEAAHNSPYFGVVWVPRGWYKVAGVYVSGDVHVWVAPGTHINIADGAIRNTPVFYLAKRGVYNGGYAARSFVEHASVTGYGGRFTIDVRNSPSVRNHAFKLINIRHFRIAKVNILMTNSNKMGGAPSHYVAGITLQSSSASSLSGRMYHPYDGTIEDVTVKGAPYGFGATQVTSGGHLRFRNLKSYGGIALRFETDGTHPSRVNTVTARGIKCVNGHAAVSFSPKSQLNYRVRILGFRSYGCESGIRIAGGGSGKFVYSSVTNGRIMPTRRAQLTNPQVSNPAAGAWIIGRSKFCISKSGSANYRIAISRVRCSV